MPGMPVKKSSEVLGELPLFEVLEPSVKNGNITNEQMCCILAAVKKFDPSNIFEFGTFDGRTTLNLAEYSRKDTRIFTLDLPQEKFGKTVYPVGENNTQYVLGTDFKRRFKRYPCSNKITQLWGDSASFDYEMLSILTGPIDMVFVDACHSKNYALNDSKKAKLMVRGSKNPVIIWHDYAGCWPGVTEALDQLYKDDKDFSGMMFLEDVQLVVML